MRQTTLDITVSTLNKKLRADVLLIPVIVEKGKVNRGRLPGLSAAAGSRLKELELSHHGLAHANSIDDQILPPTSPIRRIALVNVGDTRPSEPKKVRAAAAAASAWCRKHRVAHAALALDGLIHAAHADAVAAWVEGFVLAGFTYNVMRTTPREKNGAPPTRLTIVTGKAEPRSLRKTIDRARKLAEATNLTRLLGHEPPNVINPVTLVNRCRTIARKHGLRCKVLNDRQMKTMKMGAILAVGGGSATKSRMIILEHPGSKPRSRPIVLVGKAITLDTGGYSIKPGNSIPDMKYDKQGGMTVIGALVAASRLKVSRRVVGIIGAAENMISGDAYRPGDIVRAYNGKTIEILSTDAEGRLVLADCLSYGEKVYKPAVLIDVATLTGAVEIALGSACAGLMANNDNLADALAASGEKTDERLWRLPLWPIYRKQITGTDGDLKNSGGRPAASITAGMFLKEFVVDKTPWAHLDIAGTATTTKATPICPVGATGFGVRLLLDFIQSRK